MVQKTTSPTTSQTTAQVQCPKCRRAQPRLGANQIYFCTKCAVQFDDDPDEGGNYSDWNPAARLERQEHFQQQRLGK